MKLLGTLAVVLCAASGAFGAYSMSGSVLTLNQADLVSVIDPAGLADVQVSCGIPVADFRNLANLKVIDFTGATGSAATSPTAVEVAGLVKFDFAATYAWGGRTSLGRSAFSGPNAYDSLGTVETSPNASWFDVSAVTGAPVTAVGFCMSSHNDGGYALSAGNVRFYLSDGSDVAVEYPAMGVGTDPLLNKIFVGFEAPAGTSVTKFRAERLGGGTSYVVIDDLSFVAVPEPMTLSLLALGGLFIARRRHA